MKTSQPQVAIKGKTSVHLFKFEIKTFHAGRKSAFLQSAISLARNKLYGKRGQESMGGLKEPRQSSVCEDWLGRE